MATNVFDMPASLFARYLEFFDIESATPMQTWDQGNQATPLREAGTAGFRDQDLLGAAGAAGAPSVRPMSKSRMREGDPGDIRRGDFRVQREPDPDDALRQADAPRALHPLLDPLRERAPQPCDRPLRRLGPSGQRGQAARDPEQSRRAVRLTGRTTTRSPTSCTTSSPGPIGSDKPCLVTYNPISRIDEGKIVEDGGGSNTLSTTSATWH